MTFHLAALTHFRPLLVDQRAAQLNRNNGPHDSRAIDGGTLNRQIAFTTTIGGHTRNEGPLADFDSAPSTTACDGVADDPVPRHRLRLE